MTIIFKTMDTEVDLEKLPDFEGIKNRFLNGFTGFVTDKKHQAIVKALQEELGPAYPTDDKSLIASVSRRLQDSALIEKPFLYLAVDADERPVQLV